MIDLVSLQAEVSAHAVVVAEHVLVGAQVKLIIVLGVLTEADGGVLVDDASDFHDGAGLELFWVSLELYHLDLGVVAGLHEQRRVLDAVDSPHERDCLSNEHRDLVLRHKRVWLSVHCFHVFSCYHRHFKFELLIISNLGVISKCRNRINKVKCLI